MDEIAPEYDVIVLGTGMYLPKLPRCLVLELTTPFRTDGMCAVWVGPLPFYHIAF
jgi:hypothetical protein